MKYILDLLIFILNSLPSENVDINVHPTKNDVHFLFEDEVVKYVYNSVLDSLNRAGDSKKFLVSLTPNVSNPRNIRLMFPPRIEQVKKKNCCYNISCHTDRLGQNSSASLCGLCCKIEKEQIMFESRRSSTKCVVKIGSHVIRSLVRTVEQNIDHVLLDVIKKSVYVGSVNSVFSVIQSGSNLWLMDHVLFMERFFYQIFIASSGDLSFVSLPSGLKMHPLICSALENNKQVMLDSLLGFDECNIDVAAQFLCVELLKHVDILRDVFSLSLSVCGSLLTLPTILEGVPLASENIPLLLLSLVLDVDWEDSTECHKNIAEVLSRFFSSSDVFTDKVLEKYIFPAAQCYYLPTLPTDDDVVFRKVVSLDKLYKVFERC